LKPDERVPKEILSLLDGQGVFFLIKGGAGSGKTSLALELLKHYRDRNGIYLSTRVSPQKLYKHFPWIKEAVKPEFVTDVTKSYEGEAESEFSAFESLGVVFQFFEEFYERACRLKNPVIVVDSWEGVAKRMAEKERMKTENALVALIEKANANLIFISEEPQQTVLDYLADGVVVLNRSDLEEELPFHSRLIREIEIQKARGTTINQSKYLFTLNGGRFQFFEPFEMELPAKSVKPRPILDKSDEVSTGIEDLDKLLDGGYQKGSFNLLEIEYGVGTAYNFLVFSAIVNFLNQSRGVAILPSEGTTAKTFHEGISPFTENFEKYTKVIERGNAEEKEARPYVVSIPLKGKTYGEIDRSMHMEWIKTIRRLEKETGDKPVLGVLGLDALEYEHGISEIEKEIAIGVSAIKDSDNVVIGIARQGQELIDKLSQISSTHFKVKNVDGAVVMYGVVPRTEVYNISADVSKGYGQVKLTPIV
jgi:KaiC/GvpD/RAD55 family RecA-like ATPase